MHESPPGKDVDRKLVRVVASLRSMRKNDQETQLFLEADGLPFQAVLPSPFSAHVPSGLAPGSQVELAGVCELIISPAALSRGRHPDSSVLMLRDATDIVVLRGGPWLTVPRFLVLLSAGLGGLLLVVLSALALRGRVQRRTTQLVREIRARHDAQVEFNGVLGDAR
ncbi:MAG: hypothetical protein NTU53_17025 [Planctomycetota bacterium]|nr:hypothetical protein [Planctomycetota bacterium]